MFVKKITPAFISLSCCLFLTLFAFEAFADGQSRWALGRPSLLIDLPADPRAESVAWAERSAFSFVPNSWTAEGGGVRFEVARIYTNNSPSNVLSEIGRKLNVAINTHGSGVISGRKYVSFSTSSRAITVIGADESAPGGATWVVIAIYNNATGMNLAFQLLNSVVVEREGNRNWALRSFGNTLLVAELPYDFSRRSKPGDNDLSNRYELHFDGMDIDVLEDTPEPNSYFEKDKTINGIIEGNRSMAGVTDFRASREQTKISNKSVELVTMNFKRGYREYTIQEIAFIEKQKAILVSIKTDPKRADHAQNVERLLRSLRFSTVAITGWKNYPVGPNGLYMDLPKAPEPPKQVNQVTIYNVTGALSEIEVREIDTSGGTAHIPDFSAKNYLEIQTALSSTMKTEGTIEKRLIDGIEARLIKITHTKDKSTFQRRILMIFAPNNNWIVDVMVANGAEDYFERLLPGIRVQVSSPRFIRQSFGKLGVSFNVQDRFVKVESKKDPNDPDFENEETAMFNYSDGNFFIMHELTLKTEANLLTEKDGDNFTNSLLSGLMNNQNIKIKAYLRDSFPINIDGVEGLHLIFDVKAESSDKESPMQVDFVMLQQGKILWTVFVGTAHRAGGEGRFLRAQVLNKLRVGL